VDIDEKDGNGKYIYPRSDNRALRPAYEPRNAQKQIIYNQPYPLYNFCVGFYYRLPKNENDLEIMTGIHPMQAKKNEMRIFPNPVTDELHIDFPNFENLENPEIATIIDLSGKKIMNEHWLNKKSIHISHLPKGIYVLKIGDYYGKFVKK
jgi:hypothetical protein